jgi:hypothetical protein
MFSLTTRLWHFFQNLLGKFRYKAPEEKSSFDKPTIELNDDDFAIVFREGRVEAVVPKSHLEEEPETPEEKESHSEVEATISYLMHCLLRDDWQEEFFDALQEYLENESEIEAAERRSQFRVIEGGHSEDDN